MKNDSVKQKKIALILGSGFSKDAGLPTTSEVSKKFTSTPSQPKPPNDPDLEIEDEINKILKKFWESVFGYEKKGGTQPSLEDHFTVLDLAANSGHHLGMYYNPKRLRALRRMSLHRALSLTTYGKKKKPHIRKLLSELNDNFNLSIISLNWDIVVEQHLASYEDEIKNISYYYPIETFPLGKQAGRPCNPWTHEGIPLIKMHGSANWVYCDSCRRMYADKLSSALVNKRTFLDLMDFQLFSIKDKIADKLRYPASDNECPHCKSKIAGRVATFSYRKDFSIAPLQTLWGKAYAHLRDANIWLIVGYSLPNADFEFLHLLKSAQLAKDASNPLRVEVITKDEATRKRYKQFFGLTDQQIKILGHSCPI